MKRTPMPPRAARLESRTRLRAVQRGDVWNSTLTRHAWLRPAAAKTGSRLTVVRAAPGTIPPDVLAMVDDRDGHFCVRCGRYREVIEHHHRRIKGMGGSVAPHTECCCCIVSLCAWWDEPACHSWAHRNRIKAEAEGLVIPRSAEFPFLFPVLVHERDAAGGQMAWPTCDGRWSTDEPEGAVA